MSKSTSSAQQFVDDSTMLRASHISAIARMCHRLGLIDLINDSIPCNTGLDLGTLVVGMVSILCVEGNIPISGKMQADNSSDEKLNNEELQRIARLLKPLGQNIGELIYVADCKLITGDNLKQLGDLLFISRFPANFKEHDRVIGQAIDADKWEELGVLAETPSPSKKCQRASYKAHESQVTIEGEDYRAIVIQTDQLDKRRTKAIERKRLKEKALIDVTIQDEKLTGFPAKAALMDSSRFSPCLRIVEM